MQRRDWITAGLVAAATFVAWMFVAPEGETVFNHYVRLAHVMLSGTLDLGAGTPDYLELARVDGRFWVIDPPAPALLCLPFVIVFGEDAPQRLICMLVGAAAVGGLWVLVTRLGFPMIVRIAVVILGALGSNLMWAATDGGLWTLSNTAAVFYLTFAFVEWSGKNRPWLVGLLVGLAGLSRIPCFAAAGFFAADYLWVKRTGFKPVAQLAAPVAGFFGLFLAINAYQYGSPFVTGWTHEQYADQPWFAKGRLHPTYAIRHIRGIFLEPWRQHSDFPWVAPGYLGTALTFTSPALFLAVDAKGKRARLLFASLALTAVPWFLHGTTGWGQFGYRFILDAWPLLMILVGIALTARDRIPRFFWAVIGFSVTANLWGTWAFSRLEIGA